MIFWLPSLLFLYLLLRLLFPSAVWEAVHLPWLAHLGHLNVVVVLSSFTLLSCPLLACAGIATPSNASRPCRETELVRYEDAIPAASSSNASHIDLDLLVGDRILMDIDDFEDLKRDGSLRYILCEPVAIRDSFGGPGPASSSDAALSSLEDAQDVSDLGEGPTDIIPMDTPVRLARSVSASDDYVSVSRHDVSIPDQEYTFLSPPEYADFLYADSWGCLFNVSANTIQGRLMDGSLSPYTQAGKLVYLTPCLGNNFYSIRRYGPPNYVRKCYWSVDRLQYCDMYVNIQVNQYYHMFKASDTLTHTVAVLIGGCLICLWRRSSC